MKAAILISFAILSDAMAGTVVLTTLPDEAHPFAPLTSLPGAALAAGVQVRIGTFPGLTEDQILDSAASGGYSAISAAFQPFGSPSSIGDGVDGQAGTFEISVRQPSAANATWIGQEIALLISKEDGQEFLIARFPGQQFPADPETGLEPLITLHLADARLIVGNRNGPGKLSTSAAPATGSYVSWLQTHPALSGPSANPDDALPHADPDGDGRSNFLEYATGGNPTSPFDSPPCQIVSDSQTGGFWIRFPRIPGLGALSHIIQANSDLVSPWLPLPGDPEPDPNPPSSPVGSPSVEWLRIPVAQPLAPGEFFRLHVKETD